MAEVKVDRRVKEKRPGLAQDARMVAMHLSQERARALAERLVVELEEERERDRVLLAEVEDITKPSKASKPVHDRSSLKPLAHTAAETMVQGLSETDPNALVRMIVQNMVRAGVEMLHVGKYKMALPAFAKGRGAWQTIRKAGAGVLAEKPEPVSRSVETPESPVIRNEEHSYVADFGRGRLHFPKPESLDIADRNAGQREKQIPRAFAHLIPVWNRIQNLLRNVASAPEHAPSRSRRSRPAPAIATGPTPAPR
ncbi:hypothetical protein [Thermosulfurimonas sp. F29]|uniref:hypothetical protein n=1 Tax=Thermosulfurimonas sp. F29 TaxID=2867247 RepID=UPI001C82B430|nr:hypothetical protein [Thermosulfurimonas sp. F29]MBX6424128.1 hypothetical protein [Thermosulfurimonas sp. F29]